MASPELVIAAAPYKLYPGGVIALKCSEWLGDSAGASIESDVRAIEGEVVRDTQAYAGSLDDYSARTTAISAMDDTLTIDMSTITYSPQIDQFGDPIKIFAAYLSVLLEGDWDDYKAKDHTPLRFDRACMISIHGDTGNPTPFGNQEIGGYPRNCPQFRMIGMWDWVTFDDFTETLHVRAFAHADTTIELLLDQIVLVPLGGGSDDYNYIEGGHNDISAVNAIVDGADGGDANGKFTWHPRRSTFERGGLHDSSSGSYGGGDYQKEKSEYMTDVVAEDGYRLASFFDDSSLPQQYAYGIVGAYHREAETYETDTFSRTESPAFGGTFGETPKGYQYNTYPRNSSYEVDGSRGKVHFTGIVPRDDGVAQWNLHGGGSPGMASSDMTMSGKFEVDQVSGLPIWDGTTTEVTVFVGFAGGGSGDVQIGPGLAIQFDVMNEQWRVVKVTDMVPPVSTFDLQYAVVDISGWTSVSSWYAVGVEVAFRIELKRFVLRAQLWEASGTDPGEGDGATWDFEDFHPVYNNSIPGTTDWEDYPYGDDPIVAADWQQAQVNEFYGEVRPFGYFGGNGYVAQWDCYWDDLVWKFEPYGDSGDVHASLEAPKGDEIGEIDVPAGAWHFVYWGQNTYTDLASGEACVELATKVWSDSGAAELQRAEQPIIYILGRVASGIVVMNWRSSDRMAQRVLVGDR